MPKDDDAVEASPKSPVDGMLYQIQKEMFPDGAIATAWVLATEWISLEGDYYTVTLTDEKAPPWHHVGILTKSQIELDNLIASEDEED
jgi:hypothetical protein